MQFILYFLHSGHKTCLNVTAYKSCYGSINLVAEKLQYYSTVRHQRFSYKCNSYTEQSYKKPVTQNFSQKQRDTKPELLQKKKVS
jgi:hypothetical protein